jgi:predicted kinase
LLSPPSPMVVAVGGLSGTGKSSLARELAPFVTAAPGALVVRSDVERKRLFGVAETEHLPADAYRAEESGKVYTIVADKAVAVIGAHHSAIVDAVFAKPEERVAIAAIAASANVVFRGLFLVADLQTRLNRVGARGLDASDANAAVALQQETFALGRIDWNEIDASGSLPDTLARARAAIR